MHEYYSNKLIVVLCDWTGNEEKRVRPFNYICTIEVDELPLSN